MGGDLLDRLEVRLHAGNLAEVGAAGGNRVGLSGRPQHGYTERQVEARITPSVGSAGDSYDNALAESVIGLYKA